jgi:hypothetical protein
MFLPVTVQIVFAKYCIPTENLATDEITMVLTGRVAFKQYVLKKHE